MTIADFGLYPVCYRCRAVTPELAEGFDNLARWEAEIGARPGVRKGLDFG